MKNLVIRCTNQFGIFIFKFITDEEKFCTTTLKEEKK